MKLFNTLTKNIVAGVALVVAVAGISGVAIAGFGPDRPTKQWVDGVAGFDHVTYNSFVNMPGKGDERNFLEGVQVGRDSAWADPVNDVTNDAEVEVKLYMHNGADTSLNDAPGNPGIARNVKVNVELPTAGTTASKEIKAFIEASNAQPTSIFDTLSLTGINGSLFDLEPVTGSGKLFENGAQIGTVDVNQLVNGGVTLADQKGCSQYVREITFRLKIKKPGYQVRKSARIAGEGADKWRESVNAKPGDKIEWRIFFQNIGSTTLNNVKIVDVVPPNMDVVAGSVELVNSNNPNGFKYGPEAVQGKQINVDIEDYAPQGGAYLYFFTTLSTDPELCGNVSLQNVAYATPEGYGAVNDGAYVVIITGKECTEPSTPVYTCNGIQVEKLGGRKIKTTVTYNGTPANRVVFKNIEYNFGDGSTPLVSTSNPVEYTFAKDGTYKVTAKVTFAVDGVNKTVTSDACASVVTFGTTVTPPKELPYTGAGSNIALFLATTMVGMFIFRAIALKRS